QRLVPAGTRRVSLSVSTRPRLTRPVPHRMVVLHGESQEQRRPSIRVSTHLLPSRYSAGAGPDVAFSVVHYPALSRTLCRERPEEGPVSIRRKAQQAGPRQSRGGGRPFARVD